jgi:DNA repair protein RecN (Recombination protein N)
MPKASFELRVEKMSEPTSNGLTSIAALFSANSGEAAKPLGKVASGGELSRIMLALKNLVAERSEISVYLFDEVDSGIGGETAQLVGTRLRNLAADNQVLCVTHLAQIAAMAHNQYRIFKTTEKGRTRTVIEELDAKNREMELARMLGDTGSKAALGLAKELLSKAGSQDSKMDRKGKSRRADLSV